VLKDAPVRMLESTGSVWLRDLLARLRYAGIARVVPAGGGLLDPWEDGRVKEGNDGEVGVRSRLFRTE
jgi:hypothetical protein